MVDVFLRLKLRLLANQFQGRPWRVVLVVIVAMWLIGGGLAAAAGLAGLRAADIDVAGSAAVGFGTTLTVGWAVLSIVLVSEDDTVDPARFALLPLPRRRLAAGLLATSLLGVAPAATALVCLASIVTWSRNVPSLLVAIVAAPIALATALLAGRALTSAAAGAVSGRRGGEATAVAIVLASSSAGLIPLALTSLVSRAGDRDLEGVVRGSVAVLGWSPLAAAWAAPWSAAQGAYGATAGRLAVAIATVGLLWWAYEASLGRRIRPSGGGGDRRRSEATTTAPLGGATGRLLPDSPFGALTARVLIYWRRDSRYVLALATLGVVAVGLTAGAWQGFRGLGLAFGPLLAAMLALTMVNEYAYDGTAAWVSLAAGVPGRTDRAARVAVLLPAALVAVVVLAPLGGWLAGRGDLAVAVTAISVAILLCGLGVSMVTSVVWIYPVPEAGSNPFSSTSGGNALSLLQQGAATLATSTLVLPVLAVAIASLWIGWLAWVALVVGVAWGTACLAAGIVWGGRRLDSRGPELLAAVRST